MSAKILIVDDNRHALDLMAKKARLFFPACEILAAQGGIEGLRMARKKLPDIVLLDVKMPDLNGYDLCQRLTADPTTSHISVILFTAYYDNTDHRIAGFESGATGFLCKPFRDEELVFQVRAILRLREREKELRMARAAAQQANEVKSTLLAGISHEFRTPLNAVVGFSQSLLEEYFGVLNDKQKEYVHYIIDSGQRLNKMVDGILDIASIGTDSSSLEIQPVKIVDIFEGTINLVRERCAKQGITLSMKIAEDIAGMEIAGDLHKLRQILYLLLSNAVKFTPHAGIITVSAVKAEQRVEISVRDQGVGIEAENLEKVFNAFFQEMAGRSDKSPGIGVSLCLVKRMVELHGGRVWVESEGRNKGCRFVFTLPLAALGR